MSKRNTTPFLLGGVIGAIVLMTISFTMGWIVTSGRAHATAREMSAQAVKDQLVPICLYQFQNQADKERKLDKVRSMDEWTREGFVREQGWATMPGSDSPVVGVARECAAQITKLAS